MTKEDFKIHINEDNDLVISMEKKTESTEGDKEGKKESRYLRREFSYSKFQQTLILPDDVDKDKIDAKSKRWCINYRAAETYAGRQRKKQPRLSKLNNMLSNSEKRDCRRGSSSLFL